MKRFEDLEVYQKAFEFSIKIYKITSSKSFDYNIKNQIQRAVLSIPINIAEGFERDGNLEFRQFLSIAKGSAGETRSQSYRLFDSEYISDKQLENRYSIDYTKHYAFSDNFLRAELNSDLTLPKGCNTIEDYICDTLEQTVYHNNVEVLIIDNLTYLNNDNEKAKYALHLMKLLKKLYLKLTSLLKRLLVKK